MQYHLRLPFIEPFIHVNLVQILVLGLFIFDFFTIFIDEGDPWYGKLFLEINGLGPGFAISLRHSHTLVHLTITINSRVEVRR